MARRYFLSTASLNDCWHHFIPANSLCSKWWMGSSSWTSEGSEVKNELLWLAGIAL